LTAISEDIISIDYYMVEGLGATHLGLHPGTCAEKETRHIQYVLEEKSSNKICTKEYRVTIVESHFIDIFL
jgi:hypothetical protein